MGFRKSPFWNAVRVWKGATCRLCAFFFLFHLLLLKILLVALKTQMWDSFHWSNYSVSKWPLYLVCESSDKGLIGKVNTTSPPHCCSQSAPQSSITAGPEGPRCRWTIHLIADNFAMPITTFKRVIRERVIFSIKAHWRNLTQDLMGF